MRSSCRRRTKLAKVKKLPRCRSSARRVLDAPVDAQRDANFERRTPKEAVSAEEVQALRKENEELRQRLRDTVNELAALREADANAATGMAPRIEAAAIRASVSQKAEGSFRRTSLAMSGLPMQRRPSGGDLSEQIRLSALGVRASMTMRSEKKLVGSGCSPCGRGVAGAGRAGRRVAALPGDGCRRRRAGRRGLA